MSEKNELQKNNKTLIRHEEIMFAGPLPHPQLLKGYNDIVPGAAKIIIDMAEKQSSHRQELEKKVINSDINNSKLGLIFGFIIGIVGITAGAIIIAIGQIVAGSVISGATLVGLVGTFVYGSQNRKKERDEKSK
ncbi:MAG: DUF2335 domain-containing protein [Parcubacteria group bacterium]|nr:DUF2335 domain-containing protein [Parcubacteria group bacterium]